jgi:hypothetical protein
MEQKKIGTAVLSYLKESANPALATRLSIRYQVCASTLVALDGDVWERHVADH